MWIFVCNFAAVFRERKTPEERCRSGRSGRSRKPLTSLLVPGFESLSLRKQRQEKDAKNSILFVFSRRQGLFFEDKKNKKDKNKHWICPTGRRATVSAESFFFVFLVFLVSPPQKNKTCFIYLSCLLKITWPRPRRRGRRWRRWCSRSGPWPAGAGGRVRGSGR